MVSELEVEFESWLAQLNEIIVARSYSTSEAWGSLHVRVSVGI
jgi:hypothetical protein